MQFGVFTIGDITPIPTPVNPQPKISESKIPSESHNIEQAGFEVFTGQHHNHHSLLRNLGATGVPGSSHSHLCALHGDHTDHNNGSRTPG